MGNGLRKVKSEVRETFAAHGQEHVFRFLDAGALSAQEENDLATQLDEVDVARCAELFKVSVTEAESHGGGDNDGDEITPIDPSEVASVSKAREHRAEWTKTAFSSMAKGEVAFVVLSGGQGTRLGFSRAKGMYDVLLPSHKTLFHLMADRLQRLHELVSEAHPDAAKAGTVRIPWYIMTSPLNDADTRAYFKENKYFGLRADDVFFFAQGTLPCMTEEGKFILESKGKLAVAPDGNGGIYRSMENKGVFVDMSKRGVRYMHVTSVDNSLVQPADPVFVGYCLEQDADVGNKGCPKVSWDEKVGVMARKGGKFNIVEYSELNEDLAKATDADGQLLFRSGNICNHFFSIPFLQDTALPALANSYHVARKKIPHADDDGNTVKPTANNGIKLEMFIFDVFPLAAKMAVFECAREAEFAPVKNAPGTPTDSPDSAREMTYALHRSWLAEAGADVEGADGAACEVSPLVSMSGEGLDALAAAVSGPLQAPLLVRLASEAPKEDAGLERSTFSSADAPMKVMHCVTADKINVYEVSA